MDEGFTPRVGTFFILVGIGLALIFAGSWTDGKADAGYLLASLISFVYGFWLRRRKGPHPQTARFSYMRKSRERNRQRKQDRADKKKQKKK
jgi:peptidoglycan biosynthesis protein MviN/MurJ (putative lipid II flippase)